MEKIIRERAFDKKIKEPGLKFNPRLALTGVRIIGPRAANNIQSSEMSKIFPYP